MTIRFQRRLRLLPGVALTLSKRGLSSVSFGMKGLWETFGRGGSRRSTIGLPGSGLRYTSLRKKPLGVVPGPSVAPRRPNLVRTSWLWFIFLATIALLVVVLTLLA